MAIPRVRSRVRFPVGRMLLGLLGGLGTTVLLQQFSVAYPTRTLAIGSVLAGLLLVFAVTNLAAAAGVRRLNARLDAVEREALRAAAGPVPDVVMGDPVMTDDTGVTPIPATVTAAEPEPDPAPAPFAATHTVPAGGMQAWPEPDGSLEAIDLGGGLAVRVVETRGDWSQVAADNGWTGWVDGRRLEPR